MDSYLEYGNLYREPLGNEWVLPRIDPLIHRWTVLANGETLCRVCLMTYGQLTENQIHHCTPADTPPPVWYHEDGYQIT